MPSSHPALDTQIYRYLGKENELDYVWMPCQFIEIKSPSLRDPHAVHGWF